MSEQTKLRGEVMEFDLMEVIHQVLRGRYVLLRTALLGLVLGLVLAVFEKPWYSSQAVFLPPHYTDLASGSASALLLRGGSDESDVYLGLLVSRTVQDDVIDHLGLMSIYHVANRTMARSLLSQNSKFGVERNALIFVDVQADNPNLAAQIANTYLDALYRLNGAMVSSSSEHRKVFFQQQLDDQKNQLSSAEIALKETQERTGLVLPGSQAQAGVNATAQLQAQIEQNEAQLAGLLVGATDRNPQVVQARAQLAQLRSELARQLADGGTPHPGLPSANRLPALTLENEQKEREVRQAETAYESVLQQYGKARLASTDPGPQLEIVDRAVPAEFKSGPNRRQLVLYGFGLGGLAGLCYLLFFEPARRAYSMLRKRTVAASR